MKTRLFLMLFFLILTNILFAQDSLLSVKKTSIDSIMNINKSKLINATMTVDTKLPVNMFKNQDGSITLYYYDIDGVCNQCVNTYRTTNIEAIKNIINKRFDHQNENHWLRKDGKAKAEVIIIKDLIVVKYLKI